jgi:membrane protein
MWFLLSSYAVLIGAEVNAEMERQTRKDTTEGRGRPMGRRGAHAADTVGESR